MPHRLRGADRRLRATGEPARHRRLRPVRPGGPERRAAARRRPCRAARATARAGRRAARQEARRAALRAHREPRERHQARERQFRPVPLRPAHADRPGAVLLRQPVLCRVQARRDRDREKPHQPAPGARHRGHAARLADGAPAGRRPAASGHRDVGDCRRHRGRQPARPPRRAAHRLPALRLRGPRPGRQHDRDAGRHRAQGPCARAVRPRRRSLALPLLHQRRHALGAARLAGGTRPGDSRCLPSATRPEGLCRGPGCRDARRARDRSSGGRRAAGCDGFVPAGEWPGPRVVRPGGHRQRRTGEDRLGASRHRGRRAVRPLLRGTVQGAGR